MNKVQPLLNKYYQVIVVALFLLVYLFSLTFVYIEGDDATTIAFHAFGRDPSLQRRYANYQAGFDVILRIFPPSEPLLRTAGILISAVSACVFALLAFKIAFNWKDWNITHRHLFVLVFLLISPELFFTGMYINPMILALVFTLLSHVLLKIKAKNKTQTIIIFVLSVNLFGIGVAIRWDSILYGLIIFLDLAFEGIVEIKESGTQKYFFGRAFLWGFAAIFFSLVFILISLIDEIGLSNFSVLPSFIYRFLLSDTSPSFSFISIAKLLGLFSPLFVVIFLLGLLSFIKKKDWKIIVMIGVTLTFMSIFIKTGSFKELLWAIPFLWVVLIEGIQFAIQPYKNKESLFWGLFVSAAVVLWFLGLHIYSNNSLLGPGFEVRRPDQAIQTKDILNVPFSQERSFTVGTVRPVLQAGFAISTPEGVRPFGGYYYVFFNGEWVNFYNAIADEVYDVINLGIKSHALIHGGGGSGILLNALKNLGFNEIECTNDIQSKTLDTRCFSNEAGETINLFSVIFRENELLDPYQFCPRNPFVCHRPVPIYLSYPRLMEELYLFYPTEKFHVTGPYTGILTLP